MRRVPLLLVATLATVAAAAGASVPGGPADPGSSTLGDAADWLLGQQDEDGCIDGHGGTSWSIIAVAAAGEDPHSGEPSLVDGLRESCPPDPDSSGNEPNTYARHILAVTAAGEDPRAFGGEDWVQELRSYYANGEFIAPGHPSALNDEAFAILALRSADVPAGDDQIQGAADTLLDAQNEDGGWPLAPTRSSEVDITAAVVEALAFAERLEADDIVAEGARGFLQDHAGAEGGCFAGQGSGANVYSTAWAIRALPLLHVDPRAEGWTEEASAWDCLGSLQTDEGGFDPTGKQDPDAWLTWETIPALAGIPHGRVSPAIDRPSASLSTTTDPTVGESTKLQAEGVPFVGWRIADGRLLEGAQAEWTPEEAGDVAMDVLLVGQEGVVASRPFQTTVEQASSEGSSSSSSSGSSGGSSSGSPADDDAEEPSPTVMIDAPAGAERNVSFTLEVTGEPEGSPITAFRLEVPGSGPTGWQAAGTFAIEVDALGEQTIEAWARDAEGHVSEPAEATIELVDAAPRIAIEGPSLVNRSTPVPFHAQARDPDGPDPEVTWTGPDDATTSGPEATFGFQDPGTHTIEAQATDAEGNTANDTWTVHARNRAPTNLTIEPTELEANASEVVHAQAEDPDGDPIEIAWRLPGEDAPSSWGSQRHLETGAPGEQDLVVNVSDPHGGWTIGHLSLPVREQPTAEGGSPVEELTAATTNLSAPGSNPARLEPATVSLPAEIRAEANTSRLLHLDATSPGDTIVNVTVALGGPLPVRGTDNVTALVPALPAGEYELAARAADAGGWGPWSNATLIVEPSQGDEPLAPASETTERATPIGLATLVPALAAALRASRRRRP